MHCALGINVKQLQLINETKCVMKFAVSRLI